MRAALRSLMAGTAIVAAVGLSSCGVFRPPDTIPVGTPVADARHTLGGATAEYPLPTGGTRLEYGRGRATYMLDFDRAGALVSTSQVLTPANFGSVHAGTPASDVLARLGHPAFTFGVSHPPSTIWNYRFGGLDGDCVVMQVSIADATHLVESVSPNTDPACDRGGDHD